MDGHALSVLEKANSSGYWPPFKRNQSSGEEHGKYEINTALLLYHLIAESQKLGGTLLDQFWLQLGKSPSKISLIIDVVDYLRTDPQSVPFSGSSKVLFSGVDIDKADFEPVLEMASEYIIRLGIVFMNPGGRESGSSSPQSGIDFVDEKTDELLRQVCQEGKFGKRKQAALKALAWFCVIQSCRSSDDVLVQVFRRDGDPDIMDYIALFAGPKARDLVQESLNGVGNALNLELNAHMTYCELHWGIEAQDHNGEVKYIYRRIPFTLDSGPAMNKLLDGDQIFFGKGKNGQKFGGGPLPLLCNIRLAVARVLKLSGAASVIVQIKEAADDIDTPRYLLPPSDFLEILDAKLRLVWHNLWLLGTLDFPRGWWCKHGCKRRNAGLKSPNTPTYLEVLRNGGAKVNAELTLVQTKFLKYPIVDNDGESLVRNARVASTR
ncbi:uncharacterized protein LACBIDRAFT_325878 [Laccaria bicolor S238N-H82]|uniref:Predicted protein n=1 Tax=Laccaria bicolor (strain S238N-H82 / ATCC MYA-4686) TaxID=486041 RepID=B0D6J5_LACBS|nr:uncharacterized protein LACBIDRAFT_325878 [Laccaria bicolor S238N-H82]EDR09967.1 predicted protein [Laccaria bicolor S238N-H82]|eukprot:XP_001879352.1 predicted protein [Laccaria bicolor S238N-H82]